MSDFDREVKAIARNKAIAFFVPRIVFILILGVIFVVASI